MDRFDKGRLVSRSRAELDGHVLVVDPAPERHAHYGLLLIGANCKVTTLIPGDSASKQISSGMADVVVLRGDNVAEAFQREIAGAEAVGVPVVVVAERKPGSALAFVPVHYERDLLAERVAGLIERSRFKREIANCDAQLSEALGRADAAEAAAVAERRICDVLRQQVSEQIHRSKNLLAILQSVARRTVADGRSSKDAREQLMGRFGTLARAYQLVTAADGQGTEIADIIEAELGSISDRVTRSGPDVRLVGSVVQTFALALHELATNALQHGALRAPEGSIVVGWTFFETDADRYLEIAWTERGGASPQRPPSYGFGLSLVSSLGGGQGARESVTFEPEGFACRLRLAHDALVVGASC